MKIYKFDDKYYLSKEDAIVALRNQYEAFQEAYKANKNAGLPLTFSVSKFDRKKNSFQLIEKGIYDYKNVTILCIEEIDVIEGW
jgi:hypothetical protein